MVDINKLTAALVVVLGDDFAAEPIKTEQLRDTFDDPSLEVVDVPLSNQIRIRSVRRQMEVTVQNERVRITDISDDLPARSGFVVLAMQFMSLLGSHPGKAYGWNLDVTFKAQDGPAGRHIAQRLISEGAASTISRSIASANVQVVYQEGAIRYTFKVEPRQQELNSDIFYVHLNAHRSERLPGDIEEVEGQLREVHGELTRLIQVLFP